jgi:competence protein ComEC
MRNSVAVVAQLSIIVGSFAVHQFSALPMSLLIGLLSASVAALTLLIVIKVFFAERRIVSARWMLLCLWAIFFSCGQASIVTYRAQDRLMAVVPEAIEGLDIRMTGVVDSLPSLFERGTSFDFFVESCEGQTTWCPKGRLVKLSWFNGSPNRLIPGQRWELTSRFRRPHARLNANLFDAELRMFEQGITAQGSVRVREATPARLVNHSVRGLKGAAWWTERARFHLRESIKTALASKELFLFNNGELQASDQMKVNSAVAGVLVALVVGDQGAIAAEWWTVFNQTGVGHLMSISGLHVTMMAGFVASAAVMVWQLWFLVAPKLGSANLSRYVPSKQLVRWCAGVAGAWGYTALAGFGIPAQRTCWMVTLAAFAVLGGRSSSAISVIVFTASAVIFIDPWSILSAGFWLSFGAVSAIIYFGSARHFTNSGSIKLTTLPEQSALYTWSSSLKSWLQKTLSNGWQSQVAATLSLLPIGAAFFSSFALLSPIANAIAIPLVSALVTPLAIVGAMLRVAGASIIGDSILWLGAIITAPLLQWLYWLASLPGSVSVIGKPELFTLWLSMCAMLWLLAPFRVLPLQLRSYGLFALLPLLFQIPQTPSYGSALITTFDVGQGSAILVETSNRRLLFDVGPSYGPDLNAGSAVIAPYLRARGFKALDGLVLSHHDVDHMGGLEGVLRSMNVDWIASSIARSDSFWQSVPKRFFACQQGDTWEWDGVKFEFIHPDRKDLKKTSAKTASNRGAKSNSASCVLKVTAAGVSALLTADIETQDELKILRKMKAQNLQADVLFVPNHGSKTSSSEAFIEAVSPKLAIVQVGFRNRFKYPNAAVLQRYIDQSIGLYRTDELGAIGVALPSLTMSVQRGPESPYWRTRLGGSLLKDELTED